ncbi:origin recognition complex subunit 2-domain-containing protein [Trametes polyzona]|nr:origin recognition complex subunit 2-domain-containing protein [Trametes polyzona]
MLSEDAYTSYAEDEDDLEEWPGDPRTPSRRFHRHALTTDEEEDELDAGNDHDYDEYDVPHPADDGPSQGFATHTAFDAYFTLASKPARTSSNVFSALLPPLSPEDSAAGLAAGRARLQGTRAQVGLWADERARGAAYRRFRRELAEGFNLLFYGCGSKRGFLNGFAAWLAEEGHEGAGAGGDAHVVVANGFQPSFAFRDLLAAIERVPGVLGETTDDEDGGEPSAGPSTSGGGLEAQVQRIHSFFSHRPPSGAARDDLPHVYVVIHNIEGAAFRAPKHRSALALLALAPRIHLCASFDHVVGAPLRWSLSEIFARKPDAPSPASHSHSTSADAPETRPARTRGLAQKRGFAWLWHDLTTLAPYDFELAYVDPGALTGVSALRGARTPAAAAAATAVASAAAGGAGGGGAMTETAARHILASVTQKAKKLFVLLGAKQLEVMDAPAPLSAPTPGAGETPAGGEAGEGAYDYDRLFAAARDNFVAQNDTALRALLGEFRDHGLVVNAAAASGHGGGEALWIPLRREALMKVVADLKAEGA